MTQPGTCAESAPFAFVLFSMVIADRSRSPHDDSGNGRGPAAEGGRSSASGGGGGVSEGDIAKHVAAAFKSQEQSFRDSLAAGLAEPVKKMVEGACTAQLASMDSRLAKLEQGQSQILRDVAAINKTLASLSHSRSVPDLGTSPSGGTLPDFGGPDVTTPAFWRKPDNTLLLCNTAGGAQVSREKFHQAIVVLAADANIGDECFELRGDPLDSRFEIKFVGASPAAQALQFFQSLQLGRGRWKDQKVPNAEGTPVQFYVQPDKNGATIKKEVLAKALKDIVASLLPGDKQVFVRKSTGSVMVDRKILASVVVVDELSARLAWYHVKRIDLKLEQSEVEEQFKMVAGGQSSS